MSLIVYIEGNIGAGKTTVIERLRKTYDEDKCLVLTEPIRNWPSFKLFCENKRKYALQFQIEVMESFNDRETKCADNKELYVFERSLFSALNIFSSLNCTDDEMVPLTQLFNVMGRKNVVDETVQILYIYVRTPAVDCLEHVAKRNKPTDGYIDLEYLQKLEKMHDTVFMGRNDVRVVDGRQSIDNVFQQVKQIIDLKKFILYND